VIDDDDDVDVDEPSAVRNSSEHDGVGGFSAVESSRSAWRGDGAIMSKVKNLGERYHIVKVGAPDERRPLLKGSPRAEKGEFWLLARFY